MQQKVLSIARAIVSSLIRYYLSYHYSGYPREATSYPVYDDSRGDRGYDRGGYRPRGGGGDRGRYDSYGGRGGGGRWDNFALAVLNATAGVGSLFCQALLPINFVLTGTRFWTLSEYGLVVVLVSSRNSGIWPCHVFLESATALVLHRWRDHQGDNTNNFNLFIWKKS